MEKNVKIKFDASDGAPVGAKIDIDIVEVPALPTADGEYKLVITNGVSTWVSIT